MQSIEGTGDHVNAKPIQYYVDEKGCHICTSHRITDRGYPVCARKVMGKKYYLDSRYLWSLKYGDIESENHICHKCDNPRCINLNHLFLGSNGDNVADKVGKSRQARHSSLSDEDIRKIKMNTNKSSLKLSKEYDVSDSEIRRIWNEDIHRHIKLEHYGDILKKREERVSNRKISFTDEEIEKIMCGEYSNKELVSLLSCSEPTITRTRIRHRKGACNE
jgi:ribosomal protein S13